MLTRELAIAEYDLERGLILPDRLTQRAHGHYLRYAERAVRIYQQGQGWTRRELHRSVREVFARESNCPTRRIEAICKLLDDMSRYNRDRHGKSAELRRRVFQMAAAHHPLVDQPNQLFENSESDVKQHIAKTLGSP